MGIKLFGITFDPDASDKCLINTNAQYLTFKVDKVVKYIPDQIHI